jgi:hypothetical protein
MASFNLKRYAQALDLNIKREFSADDILSKSKIAKSDAPGLPIGLTRSEPYSNRGEYAISTCTTETGGPSLVFVVRFVPGTSQVVEAYVLNYTGEKTNLFRGSGAPVGRPRGNKSPPSYVSFSEPEMIPV